MEAASLLLLFGDEQYALPGIPRCAPSAGALVEEARVSFSPLQCPGQLALGTSQMLLADADPEPLQPSLLPDPAPWEGAEALGHRSAPALSPLRTVKPVGQLRLFPLRAPRMNAWL